MVKATGAKYFIFTTKHHDGFCMFDAKKGGSEQWLALTFDKPEIVIYIALTEQIRNCLTREFILEYKEAGVWKPVYSGKEIGMDFCLKFAPVKTKEMRIRFQKTDQNYAPSISKFDVFKL